MRTRDIMKPLFKGGIDTRADYARSMNLPISVQDVVRLNEGEMFRREIEERIRQAKREGRIK